MHRKFMELAISSANLSPCLKKKVGAVLVQDNTEIVLGRGFGGWIEPCGECVRKKYTWQQDGCWSIHSELRAIFDFFINFGYIPNLKGSTMYVTHGPCDQCLKYMSFFAIGRVIYKHPYHNDYTKWDGYIDVYRLEDSGELVLESNKE